MGGALLLGGWGGSVRQLSSEPRQVICAAHGGTSGSHIGPCLELRLERLKKKGADNEEPRMLREGVGI